MLFVDWLDNELQKRRWTPARLAREAGITKGALSHIFNGTRQPGVVMIKAIARALHLPPEQVFRVAGLLESEPDPEATPSLGEWIQIFMDADEQTREHMLANARNLLDDEPRRKKV